MPTKVGAKVASWPILGRKLAILATFFEKWTSDSFFLSFPLILRGKPNWKSIGPKLTILASKKTTKMALSQNPTLPKWQSPWNSLLLQYVSTNLSETLKIDVNTNLANTKILIMANVWFMPPKRYWAQIPKESPAFLF